MGRLRRLASTCMCYDAAVSPGKTWTPEEWRGEYTALVGLAAFSYNVMRILRSRRRGRSPLMRHGE